MSFEPTLIISKSDLTKNIGRLEANQHSNSLREKRVSAFLIEVDTCPTFQFDDGIELVMCRPELSSFNKEVRDELDYLGIDYRIDNT